MRELIAQERDSRELKALKQDWVDTAAVRELVEKELSRDPELTRSELAHWLNMQQIDFDRQLGYSPGKNGQSKAADRDRGREQGRDRPRARPA